MIILGRLICFEMQRDTKWGGLKAGQVMAPPNPIFARIEVSDDQGGGPVQKKVSKKKEKPPPTQTAVGA